MKYIQADIFYKYCGNTKRHWSFVNVENREIGIIQLEKNEFITTKHMQII